MHNIAIPVPNKKEIKYKKLHIVRYTNYPYLFVAYKVLLVERIQTNIGGVEMKKRTCVDVLKIFEKNFI